MGGFRRNKGDEGREKGPLKGGFQVRSRPRAGCQYPLLKTQQHGHAYIIAGGVDDSCRGQ